MALALNKVVGEAQSVLEPGGTLPVLLFILEGTLESTDVPRTDHLLLQLDSNEVHAVPMMRKQTTTKT